MITRICSCYCKIWRDQLLCYEYSKLKFHDKRTYINHIYFQNFHVKGFTFRWYSSNNTLNVTPLLNIFCFLFQTQRTPSYFFAFSAFAAKASFGMNCYYDVHRLCICKLCCGKNVVTQVHCAHCKLLGHSLLIFKPHSYFTVAKTVISKPINRFVCCLSTYTWRWFFLKLTK